MLIKVTAATQSATAITNSLKDDAKLHKTLVLATVMAKNNQSDPGCKKSILEPNLLGESSMRLPIEGLPYKVQNIVTTYAKALNCPIEFVLGAAMTAAAQAAGNRFYWSNGIHTCYPQFYTALVGDSTANKTASIRKMFMPLELADREAYRQWEQTTADMKKAEKARTPYRIGLMQDYTLEAYQDTLKFNPNGVTAYADEIISFFGNFDKYRGNGADEKFFLSVFGNYSDYKRTRRGEGVDLIPIPIVRIIGGVQPEILQPTFGNSTMLADGMLPRFLWYPVPEDFHFDETGEPIDTRQVEYDWNNVIQQLLNQKERIRLVFDSEAQKAYKEYKIEHSKAKNRKTLFGYKAAVCGKLEIYAIIWAMTSRLLRYAADNDGEGETLTITGFDMSYSLRCMGYFQESAMSVFHTIIGGNRHLKPADCIRGLADLIKNQSQFAESIGYSQQYVNKVLKEK